MPRFVVFPLILTTILLCSCPKPSQLSTDTGVAIGGGGVITPEATTQVEMTCVGPENPELRWVYKVLPEAEMTPRTILSSRNIPQVAIGYDGTAYFTACALPAAKKELMAQEELLEERQQEALTSLSNPDLLNPSFRIGKLAENAPKEAWLFAVSPDGEFKWVFKAPAGPVGMPMITVGGDIVIGTYSIHDKDFDPQSKSTSAIKEQSGGVYVIRPNGEFLREIDPGGWLHRIMLGPEDTLICRISDEGEEKVIAGQRIEPAQRYAVLNLDGVLLWERPQDVFDIIDTDHQGMLLAAMDSGIFAVDPLTGEPAEKYRAADPRTAEWGMSEFGEDGVLYSVNCDKTAILELLAGDITIKEANHSVPLVKLDSENNKLWEVLAGMGVMDLAARSDGSLLMIRSLAVYDSLAPNSFRDECKLICLDQDGNVAWSYLDDLLGHLWTITLDDGMNCYITSNGHGGLSRGVLSLDKDGDLRWQLPLDRVEVHSGLTFGPGGTMYIVTNDEVYAYGEAKGGEE